MAKIMSEELKEKLAERLGVDGIVRLEGWGGVPSRHCGNLVRLAIEEAERNLGQRTGGGGAY
jgi:small acid-soluble spore protein F (minor alpha/beta-type SASP)